MSGGTAWRGPFEVDVQKALEALRAEWGEEYTVCYDSTSGIGGGRWRAWRLGGIGAMIAGKTPDELGTAIRADWAERSTR